MVALEGQHTAKLTNAFSKEVPSSINRERIWGVFEAEAKSKSSVRIKTMLGLSIGASATSSWGVPDAEQLVMKRRETIRETRTPKKSALLFALKVVLSLRTIAKHLFGHRQFVSRVVRQALASVLFPRVACAISFLPATRNSWEIYILVPKQTSPLIHPIAERNRAKSLNKPQIEGSVSLQNGAKTVETMKRKRPAKARAKPRATPKNPIERLSGLRATSTPSTTTEM